MKFSTHARQSVRRPRAILSRQFRHEEAIHLWERSAKLDSSFAIVWRNLGIGYFNIRQQPAKARAAFRCQTIRPRGKQRISGLISVTHCRQEVMITLFTTTGQHAKFSKAGLEFAATQLQE